MMATVSSLNSESRRICLIPPSSPPRKDISLVELFTSSLSFFELTCILWEARRTEYLINRNEKESFSPQVLLIISVSLELIGWCGEKQYFELSNQVVKLLRKIYTVAKIALYSQVVLDDSLDLRQLRVQKQSGEAKIMQLELLSHFSYFVYLILSGSQLLLGIHFPMILFRNLQMSSLFFDLIGNGLKHRAYIQKKARAFLGWQGIYG